MADVFPPTKQRAALLELVRALGCRDAALRRDEWGDWRINGKKAYIYAVPGSLDRPDAPGFQIFVVGWTANGWNRAKAGFKPFAELTIDGDDEGAFFLDRLPSAGEAGIIRHYVGIAKRAEYSEEVLAQKREQALMARQKIGQKTLSDGGVDHSGVNDPCEANFDPGQASRRKQT